MQDKIEKFRIMSAAVFHMLFGSSLDDYAKLAGFLGTLGVTLFLYATHQPVPDGLTALTTGFIGYYIGRTVTINAQSSYIYQSHVVVK